MEAQGNIYLSQKGLKPKTEPKNQLMYDMENETLADNISQRSHLRQLVQKVEPRLDTESFWQASGKLTMRQYKYILSMSYKHGLSKKWLETINEVIKIKTL